jgi:hypothetical protein
MHCISDPCETNCSRCSSHWLGALSAHTVRISFDHRSPVFKRSRTVPSPDECGILNKRPQHCDGAPSSSQHIRQDRVEPPAGEPSCNSRIRRLAKRAKFRKVLMNSLETASGE